MKWAAIFAVLATIVVAAYWPYRSTHSGTRSVDYDQACESELRLINRQIAESKALAEAELSELRNEFGENAEDVKETARYMIGVHTGRRKNLPCNRTGY